MSLEMYINLKKIGTLTHTYIVCSQRKQHNIFIISNLERITKSDANRLRWIWISESGCTGEYPDFS